MPTFNSLEVTITSSANNYGLVLNALLNFVIVASVIFFIVINPVNALMAELGHTPTEEQMRECPDCIFKVPDQETRCFTAPLC